MTTEKIESEVLTSARQPRDLARQLADSAVESAARLTEGAGTSTSTRCTPSESRRRQRKRGRLRSS